MVNAAALDTFEALLRGGVGDQSSQGYRQQWPPISRNSAPTGSLTIPVPAATLGPIADPLNPQPGQLIGPGGRYEIIELLGSGGQGDVFKARDTQHQDRLVAIKFYRRRSTGSIDVETARRELSAMEDAAFPGLVCVKYIEQHFDYYFVVMEHVEGENLSELLDALVARPSSNVGPATPRTFSTEACCWILAKLEAPLEHLHRHGLCHQDLKPANLIASGLDPLAQSGFESASLKILDLGCASRFDVKDGRSSGAGPIGTAQYMPVSTFQTHDASPERDVYSVAATLFHLRTGMQLAVPSSWAGMRSRRSLERCQANRQRQIADFLKAQRRGSRADRRLAKAIVRGLHESPSMRPASIGHFLYMATGGRAGVAPSWRPSRRMTMTAAALALCATAASAFYAVDLDEKAVLLSEHGWRREVTHVEAIEDADALNAFPAARRTFQIRYANDLPGALTAGIKGRESSASIDRLEDDIFEVSVELPDQGRHEIKVLHRDRVIFSRAVLVDTGIRSPRNVRYGGPEALTPGEAFEFEIVFDEPVSIEVAWSSEPREFFFSSGTSLSTSHRVATDASPQSWRQGQEMASGSILVDATDALGNKKRIYPNHFIKFRR